MADPSPGFHYDPAQRQMVEGPPAKPLPTASSLLGEPPTQQPKASDLLGAPPEPAPIWTGPEAAEYAAASVPLGNVLKAFGQAANTAWDHGENLGYSDDVNAWMKKVGIYGDVSKSQGGILRTYNEALLRPAVTAAFALPGALLRGTSALFSGAQAGVAQIGEEVGAPILGRDIAAVPEAFFGQPGGLGMPHPLAEAEVARAAELKIIGPGGKDAWAGTGKGYSAPITATMEEPIRAQVSAAQEAAKAEPAFPTAEPAVPAPNIDARARQIAPETFQRYDALTRQRDALRAWIGEQSNPGPETMQDIAARQSAAEAALRAANPNSPAAAGFRQTIADIAEEKTEMERRAAAAQAGQPVTNTPDIQLARQHLAATLNEIDQLSPDVKAAYQKAGGMPEPAPTPQPEPTQPATQEPVTAPAAPPEPEPVNIAQDVSSKLVAAGRPQDEADAAAQLVQAHYEARAARFGGAKGSGADLYNEEAPDIVAGRSRARTPEMAQTMRGKINLNDAGATITLMKDANASTFIHETGHAWLEELMSDAKDEQASPDLTNDAQSVKDWLGVKEGDEITTRQHEKFARGFERYMMEGTAPSARLAGVFQQFKQWLTSIYQTVQKLRSPINDDIRRVFDRLISTPEERAVIVPETAPGTPALEAGAKVSGDMAAIHEADAARTPPEMAGIVADQMKAERARTISDHAPEIADDLAGRPTSLPTGPGREPEAETPGTITTAEPGPGEGNAAAKSGEVGGGGSNAAEKGPPSIKPEPAPEQPAGPHEPVEAPAGLVDKAGNIRLDNLNSTDDVKEALRELAAQNDDFMSARGGVISDAQRSEMADALGLTMDNFAPQKPEGISSSVWADAVQKLTFQAADQVSRLGKAFGESGSPQDAATYLAAKQRLLLIADHFSTLTAEAGRTLRVFDKEGFAFAGDMIATMEKDTGKTLYQLQQEAKAVGALETTAQRSKMMQDMREPTRLEKIKAGTISWFINALISGPITHAGYSIGNTVMSLFKAVPLTAAEATIDATRAAVGGPLMDRVYYGEVGAQLYGMFRGARDGIVPGWKALKSGVSYMEGAERLAAEDAGKTLISDATGGKIGQGLEAVGLPASVAQPVGYVMETPSRAVAAIHTLFYSMNYERNIARMAYRQASNEGLRDLDFTSRVADLTQNPPVNMVTAAHNDALDTVLMRKPVYGTSSYHLIQAVNKSFPAKIIMPFMQVGMNILKEGVIDSTPLGLASQSVRDNLFGRNGEVARTQQYARIMVGSGMAAGVMGLAAEGLITGAGPSDPQEAMAKEATGWKAYSLRVGDHYVPYRKLIGPLGPLVGAAATTYEVGNYIEQGEASKAVGALTLGMAQVTLDETWMKGASDFLNAVRNPTRDGEKYVRNLALDFVPFSIGLSQVAREVDDQTRRVNSWTDAFRNKIPGLSETLYPWRDWTGTPIPSATALSTSIAKNDPTMDAMEKAEFYPAMLRKDIRGVPLSPRQYDDFARVSGMLAKQRMDQLVNTPGFTDQPEGFQQRLMAETLSGARKSGEDWVMMQPENSNILRQAIAAKEAQMTGAKKADVKAIRQTVP